MAVKYIPDGYHTVTPYLSVCDAEHEVEFMQKAFGGELKFAMRDVQGGIRHAEVRIGDSMVMVGRAREQFHPRPMNFYLYVADCDDSYRKALAAGGKSVHEPVNHEYGDRSGGVEDPEGNHWWIATHIEDVSGDEIARRMKSGTQPATAA
jgi:PhnB protein